MTKTKALFEYFNRFMPSWPADSVPDDATLPMLTYSLVTGAWGDLPVSITVNLWFKTDSEATANAKADELRQYITENEIIDCGEGFIWVKPGSPWCQALRDDVDPFIKRRYINITLEYLTR